MVYKEYYFRNFSLLSSFEIVIWIPSGRFFFLLLYNSKTLLTEATQQ